MSTSRSVGILATRSIRNIRRLPSAFFPALAMPIFNMVVFAGTFFAVTKIPGFPTDRSINWYMPLGIMMGSAFAGVGLGFTAIRDIETGFYDRLRMTPTSRLSLVLGPLTGTLVRVVMMTTIVIVIGIALGARFTGGVLGILCLYAAALGLSTIGAGWGLGLAFIFKDMRGAAIMQLSIFLVMFLSSAQVPLNVMDGWLHTVARINPATNILRLARVGLVNESNADHLSFNAVWGGIVAIVVMGGLSLGFALRQLRKLSN
ncbi:MAG: ABC transporter permease [Ilumatobacteraceae bacterium]|jgi:ABC-2 type transport system permease protein